MSINHWIDLRSDTLTVPTPAMREAMASAEVGDDVYGEDPTVNKLQDMIAAKTGMEAALFVSSGTQGNLLALLAHCGRGDEAILGTHSHMFIAEAGGSAAVGGIHPRTVPTQPDGTLRLDDLQAAIRGDNEHYPITRMIALENTSGSMYGAVLPPDYVAQVRELTHRHHLALHIDGARIFNACVAQGVDITAYTRHIDSISICLSKGLGAPVGSLLCGSKAFIRKAHRARKLVGGATRQAGVLAAAGIVALEQMIDRLRDDHDNARVLAEGINRIAGLTVKSAPSNIVFIDIDPDCPIKSGDVVKHLADHRIKIGAFSPTRMRAVTHCYVDRAEILAVLQVLTQIMASAAPVMGQPSAIAHSPYFSDKRGFIKGINTEIKREDDRLIA